jgi:hypothetical protein
MKRPYTSIKTKENKTFWVKRYKKHRLERVVLLLLGGDKLESLKNESSSQLIKTLGQF